jgi:hypothetical protein
MRQIILPPFAPAMLNSLRALGYSFEAALADVLDNSIAAQATRIDIQFRTDPEPYLAIIDDGHGMMPEHLVEAMRHGGIGPDHTRHASDLGRFGLGLKTASFSQCKRLTVVSVANGILSGARWDLALVEQRGDWILELLSSEESAVFPHVTEIVERGHGTVVLWEVFDRATAGESAGARALGELVDRGRDHLALAFHRYLDGEEGGHKLRIAVNNVDVRPVDPFLSTHKATQRLPAESLAVEGIVVSFQPFILPHLSKLSQADLALAGGEDGLRRNQGFFVYRNRRLITSGTWFRLLRREELTKLARVRIDIPNSLDHLWALDVKKSAAHPPEVVRAGLRRVIERIGNTSRQVFRFRGRRSQSGLVTHAWERVVTRDGVSYMVNRNHPMVEALREIVPAGDRPRLESLLRMIEMSFPADTLYADMASEQTVRAIASEVDIETHLTEMLARLVEAAGPDPSAARRVVDAVAFLEPFSLHPSITRRITEPFRHVD